MIVGGGYSGVETAGEILDRLQAGRLYYRIIDTSDLPVTLVKEVVFEVTRRNAKLRRWAEEDIPERHFTNGIHVPSWDSPSADALWI